MARSESDSNNEPMDSLSQLKKKVRGLNKAKLEVLLFILMDECDAINAENCMLKHVCSDLKRDVRNIEHANENLKSERLEVNERTLILHEDLNKLKETLSMREKVFNTDLSKLESGPLQLKQRIKSLIYENSQLLEKLKKVESNLTANKRWNSSSTALKWLNTHNNRNEKGLGFVTKRTINPVRKKYVGFQENIISFHYGKMGHYRYTCPLRKYTMERNMIYVKQIWVRQDEICMSKRMGPKWIWVPKTNP